MAKRFFYVCAGLLCLALTYHLGARSAGAQSAAPSEVAVAMGSVEANGIIPLPTYQDGTTALIEECRWIVSPGYVNMTRYDPKLRCEATGDAAGLRMSWLSPNDPLDPARANYLMVAVRSGSPTLTGHGTFGSLKARYHGEREPQGVKQPTNR